MTKTQQDWLGVAMIAFSVLAIVSMFAGAAWCDFDPRATQGECLRSIYHATFVN